MGTRDSSRTYRRRLVDVEKPITKGRGKKVLKGGREGRQEKKQTPEVDDSDTEHHERKNEHHYRSGTMGRDENTEEREKRFIAEVTRLEAYQRDNYFPLEQTSEPKINKEGLGEGRKEKRDNRRKRNHIDQGKPRLRGGVVVGMVCEGGPSSYPNEDTGPRPVASEGKGWLGGKKGESENTREKIVSFAGKFARGTSFPEGRE